jgi:hypothetical protein
MKKISFNKKIISVMIIICALACVFSYALAATFSKVSSKYYGTVINMNPKYSYAPTIMKDGNIYKMWFCGQGDSGYDEIYYSTSNDSFNWSAPRSVLRASGGAEGVHACDPSIVKVNNIFYMYYTSEKPGTGGTGGSIFLAVSSDGINWFKNPANTNPQPVLACLDPNPGDYYGRGQSSVIFKDGVFYHYFTDITHTTYGVYLATSRDAVHFTLANYGKPVFTGDIAVDVKYNPIEKYFFMVSGNIASKQYWYYSSDGIKWPSTAYKIVERQAGSSISTGNLLSDDNTATLASGFIDTLKPCNHNPGILSDPLGNLMSNNTVVYYGAGLLSGDSCWNPTTWGIDAARVSITIASSSSPAIYKNKINKK